jgi:hypothetical protein
MRAILNIKGGCSDSRLILVAGILSLCIILFTTLAAGERTIQHSSEFEVMIDDFMVNDPDSAGGQHEDPHIGVDSEGNFIYFAWQDSRTAGHEYDIFAKVIRWEKTSVNSTESSISVPLKFKLAQNYPNPFNPTTSIQYSVIGDQSPLYVTLKIYNILGQEVRTLVNELKEPGYYTVTWDGVDSIGREVGSGIYVCRLEVGDFMATKRMVLMK